jgi:hypothetical protein
MRIWTMRCLDCGEMFTGNYQSLNSQTGEHCDRTGHCESWSVDVPMKFEKALFEAAAWILLARLNFMVDVFANGQIGPYWAGLANLQKPS